MAKLTEFRYLADIPETTELWRPGMDLEDREFDAVVKVLQERDHQLEDYLTSAAHVDQQYVYSAAAVAGTLGGVTGAWITLPGSPTLAIKKRYSDTALSVTMSISGYKTTNLGQVQFGLFDGTNSNKLGHFFFNELASHNTMTASAHIMQGRRAGSYNLLGVGQVAATEFNQDDNDWNSWIVQEVYDT